MTEQQPEPRYGERAPEGWHWKPEGADTGAAAGNSPAAGSGSTVGPVSREPGVPHNLGVNQQDSPDNTVTPGQAPTMPAYRPATQPQGGAPVASGKPSRRGDRIATIILLVAGTIGAVYLSLTMMLMKSSFNIIADLLNMANFSVPTTIQTLGTVGALILLGLYAVMLIFAIQRMRAGKVAFWIPLVAGIISVIVVVAIMSMALAQMPEILKALADPDNVAKLLDLSSYLSR